MVIEGGQQLNTKTARRLAFEASTLLPHSDSDCGNLFCLG